MRRSCSLLVALALLTGACERKTYVPVEPGFQPPREGPEVSVGPLVGEVGPTSAVVWAKAARAGRLHVEVVEPGAGIVAEQPTDPARDQTAKVELKGLKPDTLYRLEVRFVDPVPGPAVTATFRTAPLAENVTPVRFAIGGDLAGQNACRHAEQGYAILEKIDADAQFFVGLGDMIYADGTCKAEGSWGQPQVPGGFEPAADRAAYWAHWRYNWSDPAAQRLFRRLGYFAVWDDHETVNNAGPAHDTRTEPPYTAGVALMPIARQAWDDYNPVRDGSPMYRRVRWGRHVELFLLDTRSFRSDNRAVDAPEAPKTMLGATQKKWLIDGLVESDATWRMVVSSVPMGVPTGDERERDSWPDGGGELGFERELLEILTAVRDGRGRKDPPLIWLATDVHFATVMEHRPLEDLEILEVVSGPLSAKLFPNRTLDETMKTERIFFHGPESIDAVKSYEEALGWYNYGLVDVDREGELTLSIIDGYGKTLWTKALAPPAG